MNTKVPIWIAVLVAFLAAGLVQLRAHFRERRMSEAAAIESTLTELMAARDCLAYPKEDWISNLQTVQDRDYRVKLWQLLHLTLQRNTQQREVFRALGLLENKRMQTRLDDNIQNHWEKHAQPPPAR